AMDPGVTGCGAKAGRDQGEQGGLAGAVGTEETEDLALRYLERDPTNHLAAVILATQVAQHDRARHRPQPRASGLGERNGSQGCIYVGVSPFGDDAGGGTGSRGPPPPR